MMEPRPFMLIAAWLTSPTTEMRQLGLDDVSFIGRYGTHKECAEVRDWFRHQPGRHNPDLVFRCVDLRPPN